MTASEKLSRDIEGVTTLLATARDILADGRAVDLAGLDDRITQLCDGIRALPEKEAADFHGRLVVVLDEVDRLTQDLAAHRAKLACALGALSIGKNVATAYHKGAGARK